MSYNCPYTLSLCGRKGNGSKEIAIVKLKTDLGVKPAGKCFYFNRRHISLAL
jgi:hypothetical protein